MASQIHVVAAPESRLPFSIEDASRPESEFEKEDTQFTKVLLDTRLNNRIIDLRVRLSNISLDLYLIHHIDTHEPSDFQGAISRHRPLWLFSTLSGVHGDPQSQTAGCSHRVWCQRL
jgi:aspartyl-tRNA synthetase